LADRPVPSKGGKVGQARAASGTGRFVLDDECFHFQSTESTGGLSQWLLVPDALHGFDHMTPHKQGLESIQDAHLKAIAYQQVLKKRLHNAV
jgi:hypothetical protein